MLVQNITYYARALSGAQFRNSFRKELIKGERGAIGGK
jgi:hypothetical protein